MNQNTQTKKTRTRKEKAANQKPGKKWCRRLTRLVGIFCCLGLLAYAGLVGFVYYQETHVPVPSQYDAIIVLGAQVLPTGEPSVQLRWRLDKAVEMYQKQPCPVVACGAQGVNEPAPEGDVMRALLMADGVLESHAFAETQSEDTSENIRNAWAMLSAMGCERPLIVTSDYHLPRALALAEDVGLHPQGAGSLCKPGVGFWMKNHMREALSWVKYWGVKHLGLPR